jgi:uncharacterized protein
VVAISLCCAAGGAVADQPPPPATESAASDPSFDCRAARSDAEKLICATPELAALDRKLAETFDATRFQGGIDAKALRKDEDRWLVAVRDRCTDVACLKAAYIARNAALLDKSLQAASPAAYAETRPFPAPAEVLSAAKSLIGTQCPDVFSPDSKVFPGFEPVAGFSTVIGKNGYVVVRTRSGIRFAFLLSEADGDLSSCRVSDVVVLPPPSKANAFLQCHLDDPPSAGFGMRLAGHRGVVAYWTIDGDQGKIDRVPLGVLAAEDRVRCQEPETGE